MCATFLKITPHVASLENAKNLQKLSKTTNTLLFYQIELFKKMDPLQFCLPVCLGIHRNPKQKEFFNSCEGFLR
jgi:hypothetical protein